MTLKKEDLIDALDEVLNKKRIIDDDTHKMHHEFIQMELERRENNKRLWMKFKLSAVGAIATGIVTGLMWVGSIFAGKN